MQCDRNQIAIIYNSDMNIEDDYDDYFKGIYPIDMQSL